MKLAQLTVVHCLEIIHQRQDILVAHGDLLEHGNLIPHLQSGVSIQIDQFSFSIVAYHMFSSGH